MPGKETRTNFNQPQLCCEEYCMNLAWMISLLHQGILKTAVQAQAGKLVGHWLVSVTVYINNKRHTTADDL